MRILGFERYINSLKCYLERCNEIEALDKPIQNSAMNNIIIKEDNLNN